MSSRYQKVLPQLTPSTSVLDTRSTTPDVTPALQFAQQLQTNLDELSVIKTPNHLAGDAEFVKRGYLDPINEAKNKAIEAFQGNNIAEGVQGLRDIKSFMLQSQQQGGVYSQIENNYKTAAEFSKQLEEGYTKGTYQDWQVNYYKKLVNNSKSFNDAGEYVPFQSSTPAQALDLPKYFNDLAKDWGKTSYANYKLKPDGLFYDMSSGSYVTKEEVKKGLVEFMKSDMKAQSYYKELSKVFGEATADSLFNNAMNAAADKEEFNIINPHYVRNPLLSDAIINQERKDKLKPEEKLSLIPTTVSVDGANVDVSSLPSKIYLTTDGKDLITPIGGMTGGYQSLTTKGTGGGFKKYPARNDYISVSLTDIMNNKDGRYTKVLNDLTSKATGLKELVLSYPFNEYKKDVKDSAKITVEDYNSKILKQYEELNKRKDITVNYKQTSTNKSGERVLDTPSGGIIKHNEFVNSVLKDYIRTVGSGGVIEVDASGKNNVKTSSEINDILDNYDPKNVSVNGTFLPGDGNNPFMGWYKVSMNNKNYYIKDPITEISEKNTNPVSLSVYNLNTSNGKTQKLKVNDDTASLFTKLFIEPNKSTGKVLPVDGTMELKMNPRFNKDNKLHDFDYSNPYINAGNTSNFDIIYRYKDANGKPQVEKVNKLMQDGKSELNLAKLLRDIGMNLDNINNDMSPNSWMKDFIENQRKLQELENNQ
jgi:hypothetical protein